MNCSIRGRIFSNLIFNCKDFKKDENYKKMLIKNEDVDEFGYKGFYLLTINYLMVLVYSYESDDQI